MPSSTSLNPNSMPSRIKALSGSSTNSLRHLSRHRVTGAWGTVGLVLCTLVGSWVVVLMSYSAWWRALLRVGDADFAALFPWTPLWGAPQVLTSGTLLPLIRLVESGGYLVVRVAVLVCWVRASAIIDGAYMWVGALVSEVAPFIQVV